MKPKLCLKNECDKCDTKLGINNEIYCSLCERRKICLNDTQTKCEQFELEDFSKPNFEPGFISQIYKTMPNGKFIKICDGENVHTLLRMDNKLLWAKKGTEDEETI